MIHPERPPDPENEAARPSLELAVPRELPAAEKEAAGTGKALPPGRSSAEKEAGRPGEALLPARPSAEEDREGSFLRGFLEVVQMLAIAIVISVGLNVFVVQVTEVRQRSMDPTLLSGDRVLVSKVDYRLHPPERNDIIVFKPKFDTSIPFVKRVIGVAGDTVDLRDGKVYVNGQAIDEPYVNGATRERNPQQIKFPFKVPPNSVFVLGDNRPVSGDSREWGEVPDDNIIGKVLFRFWPPQTFRFFAW